MTNRDLLRTRHQEKINSLRKSLNKTNQLQLIGCHKEEHYTEMIALQQKVIAYERELQDMRNENNSLKGILKERNQTIEEYEAVIIEIKDKAQQLLKTNDMLRRTIESNAFSQREMIKTNYLEPKIGQHPLSNNTHKEMLYSSSSHNVEMNKQSQRHQAVSINDNAGNQMLYKEMNNLKQQIREIQHNFLERIDKKDNTIELLCKEREELLTEIENISKDKEILSERLYTQNDNEVIALKSIINEMNPKGKAHDDVFYASLNKLNALIMEKDKQIQELKQRSSLHKRQITSS